MMVDQVVLYLLSIYGALLVPDGTLPSSTSSYPRDSHFDLASVGSPDGYRAGCHSCGQRPSRHLYELHHSAPYDDEPLHGPPDA